MTFNIKKVTWIIIIIVFSILIRLGFEYIYNFFDHIYTFSQFLYLSFRFFIFAIVALVWLSIAANSSQNINKLPWLIVLALEPFVGLALFLSFGRSFDRSRRYRLLPFLKPKEYLLKEQKVDMSEKQFTDIDSEITDIFKAGYNLTGHVPYLNTTNVTVLTNGEKTFPTLLEEIEKATAFICMQYYIIRTDKIGSTVLNKLKEKASNGIEVFLQFDAFGSIFLNKKMIKQLKESGVKIVKNDPVYFGLFNTKVNFRNHRKVIVIDGKVGFLGGLNLADEYNQGKPKKYGIFRDTHLKIEGEAVRSLTQLFFRDWGYNTETLITDDKYYPDYKTDGLGLVQILPSGPEFKHPPIRNVYVKMINNAKQSIKIMTPYIALDHELLTSLVIASNSGVEVSIILPGIPDKKSIYTVSKSFIEDLLEEGINVYFYTPGFCHAKVFIIDDMIASCGSYNLDNRSAKINFEVTALLYSQGVKKLVNDFNNDLFNSKQIQLKKWNKRGIVNRVYEGIMNLFSPLV